MSQTAWLEKLKPGDKVIVASSGYWDCRAVHAVARVTSSQIVLSYGVKFRRKDGRRVGIRSEYLSEFNAAEQQSLQDRDQLLELLPQFFALLDDLKRKVRGMENPKNVERVIGILKSIPSETETPNA